jgi:hypothetical protein
MAHNKKIQSNFKQFYTYINFHKKGSLKNYIQILGVKSINLQVDIKAQHHTCKANSQRTCLEDHLLISWFFLTSLFQCKCGIAWLKRKSKAKQLSSINKV